MRFEAWDQQQNAAKACGYRGVVVERWVHWVQVDLEQARTQLQSFQDYTYVRNPGLGGVLACGGRGMIEGVAAVGMAPWVRLDMGLKGSSLGMLLGIADTAFQDMRQSKEATQATVVLAGSVNVAFEHHTLQPCVVVVAPLQLPRQRLQRLLQRQHL